MHIIEQIEQLKLNLFMQNQAHILTLVKELMIKVITLKLMTWLEY